MSEGLAVVILAGGEGSRIGGEKPLRMLGGERLIDRAMRQAHQWSEVIAVSLRDAVQVQRTDVSLCIDERGVEGPLAGLIAALRFAEASRREFLLTIPADMPFLPGDFLDRLFDEIDGRACALASSGAHLHPVCGLWRTNALADVESYLATGRRSLRGFAEMIGFRAVEWPTDALDPFFNINAADDLARAERILSEIEGGDELAG